MNTKTTAERVAKALLEVKAVKLQPDAPFTWASGWKSPIYCDNRVTLSYPAVRTLIKEELAEAIRRDYGMPEVIAGVATGAMYVPRLRIMVWAIRSRESSPRVAVSSS